MKSKKVSQENKIVEVQRKIDAALRGIPRESQVKVLRCACILLDIHYPFEGKL